MLAAEAKLEFPGLGEISRKLLWALSQAFGLRPLSELPCASSREEERASVSGLEV